MCNQEVAIMTDRIEKTIDLNAPVERVWRAIHAGDAGGADPTTGGAAPHFDESTGHEGQTDRTDGAGA